jgi:thiol-disulfide isomerase/thioredoxin
MNSRFIAWLFVALLAGALPGSASAREEAKLGYKMTPIEPPVPAPGFVLEDMDGERYTLEDFRGKVVLVNFWATWCPPCRREMPSLERLYQAMKDKPFVVLALNQWESADHVFSYMGDLSVFPTFPILFDSESRVSEAFGVKGLPTSFILDKQGRLVYRAIGGREFDNSQIEKLIDTLILE